jgi:hypothetical protein
MSQETMTDLYRFCVKFYAPEPAGLGDDAAVFVPIFHEWIREHALSDVVLFDVADYAHVPDSPGIMLVAHEVAFALDRSDGRFGLLAQRRTPSTEGPEELLATMLRQSLRVIELLEGDPRLEGRLRFDTSRIRVESNDRLRAPNTEEGSRVLEPIVSAAVGAVFPGVGAGAGRVENDPRDRLALEVRLDRDGSLRPERAA